VRFLLDENQSPRLMTAVLHLDPAVDVLRVGDVGAPHLGTSDAEILEYLTANHRALVTSNRTSLPPTLEAHQSAGKHLWGIFWVRPHVPVSWLARDLYLIWEAAEAEEWRDRSSWIPF
jgi:hypothetical protein